MRPVQLRRPLGTNRSVLGGLGHKIGFVPTDLEVLPDYDGAMGDRQADRQVVEHDGVLDVLAELVAERLEHRRPSRVTYTRAEAAEAIGCSLDFFEDHIQPDLRLVRLGRKVLVPVEELYDYVDRVAEYTLPRRR